MKTEKKHHVCRCGDGLSDHKISWKLKVIGCKKCTCEKYQFQQKLTLREISQLKKWREIND